jgi:hypothetical protein
MLPTCTADPATCGLIAKVSSIIINPLLALLAAVAVLIFIWGVVQYMWNLRKGESTKEGKEHMIWGLVGLFVIVSALAILNIIINTVQGLFP